MRKRCGRLWHRASDVVTSEGRLSRKRPIHRDRFAPPYSGVHWLDNNTKPLQRVSLMSGLSRLRAIVAEFIDFGRPGYLMREISQEVGQAVESDGEGDGDICSPRIDPPTDDDMPLT